jgi:hypothetical protein
MDRKLSKSQEIEHLTRLADEARSVLSVHAVSVKRRLDVPSRVKSSLQSHPTGWIGGGLAFGMLLSTLFRRKKVKPEKKVKRGLFGFLLTLVIAAARPAAQVWFTGQVRRYVGMKLGGYPPSPDPGRRF